MALKGGNVRPIDRARALANPKLPRRGHVMTRARRGLIANDGLATTSQLLEWVYPRSERRKWHYGEIARALRRIGIKEVGRAHAIGRPIIWSLDIKG
jgi:hypothetical protein